MWLVCEHSDGVANSFELMVDEATFDEKMARGEVECEEELMRWRARCRREARLRRARFGLDAARVPVVASPSYWSPSFQVYSYQVETVSWMLNLEADAPRPLVYDGNLKITSTWYVDTEDQSRRATRRSAGGADGRDLRGRLGCGKTATALLLAQQPVRPREATSGLYESSGTLFLLPINLIGQWKAEKSRSFCQTPQPFGSRGARSEERDAADAVRREDGLHDLRAAPLEPAYQTLVDDALNGRPRERCARRVGPADPAARRPVIEAVRWSRIVVDEMHQVFESPRDVKVLRMFRYDFLWGLTATPVVEGDGARLYAAPAAGEGPPPLVAVRGAPMRCARRRSCGRRMPARSTSWNW